jgi:hypothetical protein
MAFVAVRQADFGDLIGRHFCVASFSGLKNLPRQVIR